MRGTESEALTELESKLGISGLKVDEKGVEFGISGLKGEEKGS